MAVPGTAHTAYLTGFQIVSLVLSLFYVLYRFRPTRKTRLPPGPPPRPLIGNLLDMPRAFQWLTFREWSKEYGDVVHVETLGQRLIVLNSLEAVKDLFVKRGSIYSDRAPMPMVVDLMGWGFTFSFKRHGLDWRTHRAAFHKQFNAKFVETYGLAQTHEVYKLLKKLLESPGSYKAHCAHSIASIALRIAYGIRVADENDRCIEIAKRALDIVSSAAIPGAFLVDVFPVLKCVPAWFPGGGFQLKGKEGRAAAMELINVPFDLTEAAVKIGKAPSCVAASLMKSGLRTSDEDEDVFARHLSASVYAGAYETTNALLLVFFLAMVLNPDSQRKAQEELDSHIGHDRLPAFTDLPKLVYLQALLKETLRWVPITPIGMPHMSEVDDEYRGYRIPKGTNVLANVWSIMHDETLYPDPFAFKPERFLNEDGSINIAAQDPTDIAFGFGRRVCPGRHFALNHALMTFASILYAFRIEHALDASGNIIPVKNEVEPGLFSLPVPFKCSIEPRRANVPACVHHALETMQFDGV